METDFANASLALTNIIAKYLVSLALDTKVELGLDC